MEEHLPVMCETLNGFLLRKAETELNEESESQTQREIQKLREMVREKQLPCYTDYDFLLCFLRAKKHQVAHAFDKLQKYSYYRCHEHKKYYDLMEFEKVRVPIERGIVGISPYRDDQGRILLFLRFCAWDPSACSLDDVFRALLVLAHFCLEFPASQVSGFCGILDNHLLSPGNLLRLVKFAVGIAPSAISFPGRIQLVAFVNANVLVRNVMPLLVSAMPSTVRKRVCFYGDAKTALPEIFPPGILPEEYGGTLGSFATLQRQWMEPLRQFLPKLLATNKHFRRKSTVHYPETSTPALTQ